MKHFFDGRKSDECYADSKCRIIRRKTEVPTSLKIYDKLLVSHEICFNK